MLFCANFSIAIDFNLTCLQDHRGDGDPWFIFLLHCVSDKASTNVLQGCPRMAGMEVFNTFLAMVIFSY